MEFTRRHAIALAGAAALLPLGARAADGLTFSFVRKSFSLRLPDAEGGVSTGLSRRPNGFLLAFNGDGPFYGRAYALDGTPAGARFQIAANDDEGATVTGPFPDPLVFNTGRALVFFPGTAIDLEGERVLARPLAADFSQGDISPFSGDKDTPSAVLSARFGVRSSITAWLATKIEADKGSKLSWRLGNPDGSVRGGIRTLASAGDAVIQTPLAIAGLTGGGAVIGFSRIKEKQDEGRLLVQIVDPEGEASGDPLNLDAKGVALGLATLAGDRFAAYRAREDGDLDLWIGGADGSLGQPVVVKTGLTSLSSVVVTARGLPAPAGDAIAILVGGFEGRRKVVSVLLVDETGAQLAKPARIVRTPDGPLVVGQQVEARHLVALDNNDLLAVHRVKAGTDDDSPPVASIVRINGAV